MPEIVKRFVGGYLGKQHYSVRKHPNGAFQIFHDNHWEGIPPHSPQNQEEPLPGLYADAALAEAELVRSGLLDIFEFGQKPAHDPGD